MAERAQSLGSQYYAGMVQQQAAQGIAASKQALVDNQTAKFNEAAGLAMQNGTNTPEFAKAYSDYLSVGKQLSANPAFGISSDIQAANDKAAHTQLMGYAFAGQTTKDMQGPGGTQQALTNLQQRVSDPSLNLSHLARRKSNSQPTRTKATSPACAATSPRWRAMSPAARSLCRPCRYCRPSCRKPNPSATPRP
jgi:hypothetical protein